LLYEPATQFNFDAADVYRIKRFVLRREQSTISALIV